MPESGQHEQDFFKALRDIFVGAKVEGESGYINLMRIKSRYYTEGVFPQLKKEIDAACKPFGGTFREELFDKLHDFFKRYFSESGSIYFRHTPQHKNIYEKVYTDDRDVMLFWKTHMLYYVKTDRLFNSLEATVDEVVFCFDVSGMQNKSSNEKRELVYTFKGVNEGKIVLGVDYSERGRKTKNEDILKAVHNKGLTLDEETLERAFGVFEKQSEVDFFINKNAKAFLEEQFNLWMYQYIFVGESAFDEKRLKELQALKGIAFKIITFIAQFEDELVRVWNKPKFVLNSHYVITLDKITDAALLEKILTHARIGEQVEEWRELGMLGADFALERLKEKDLVGEPKYPKYQYLPLDTKYFADLEVELLGLFDHLDQALDGWLVHSENYQALVSTKLKFSSKISCVHIDPPYNTDSSGFLYINAYQHASWLTMIENRIGISKYFLNETGSFLIHIDENEYDHLSALLREENYCYQGTVIWDKKNPMMGGRGIAQQHEYIMWCSHHDGNFNLSSENSKAILDKAKEIIEKYNGVTQQARKEFSDWVRHNPNFSGGEKSYQYINDDGRVYQSVGMGWPNPTPPPPQFYTPLIHPVTKKACPVPPRGWSQAPDNMNELVVKGEIIFGIDETTQPRRKIFLTPTTSRPISSVIQNGQKGKQELDRLGLEFSYCHPVSLYENLSFASLLGRNDGYILDYFAGSGTSGHATINLNRTDNGSRKYILVEMGEQFITVMLPRIKKVAFSDQWKDGKAQGGKGMSHFAKYYELEQYEQALKRASYGESLPFAGNDPYGGYVFLRDLKMLEAVKVDREHNKVEVHLEKLYPNIDLAETLSCVLGKAIRRITKETVTFEDGSTASLSDPDWKLVRPLVWW